MLEETTKVVDVALHRVKVVSVSQMTYYAVDHVVPNHTVDVSFVTFGTWDHYVRLVSIVALDVSQISAVHNLVVPVASTAVMSFTIAVGGENGIVIGGAIVGITDNVRVLD